MKTERYKVKTVRVSLCCEVPDHGQASGPDEVAKIAVAVWNRDLDWDKESFVLLACDARGKVVGYKVVGIGTMTSTLVHPREVFRAAIMLGAATVFVVHNHPSGDLSASQEDVALTERLRLSGELLGIPVVDHLIVAADGRFTSLAEGRIDRGKDRETL